MAQDTNQNRPADVAQADSVGGMAKRLLNPAHLQASGGADGEHDAEKARRRVRLGA